MYAFGLWDAATIRFFDRCGAPEVQRDTVTSSTPPSPVEIKGSKRIRRQSRAQPRLVTLDCDSSEKTRKRKSMETQIQLMESQISASHSMSSFFDTTARYNMLKDMVSGDWADDQMRADARARLRSLAGLG